MGKEKTTQVNKEATQKSPLDELTKNGSATLKAKTREELADMLSKIPSDVKFGAGPIGQDYDNGVFICNLILIKE